MAASFEYSTSFKAKKIEDMAWTSWIEVDLDALEANLRQIEEHSQVTILPIIKGDAYGHGSTVIAAFLKSLGYQTVGVSILEEALAILRYTPLTVFLLSPPAPSQLPELIKHPIVVTVTYPELVEELARLAQRTRKRITVQVKVDTGFGRFGLSKEESLELILSIKKTPGLKLEGVFTHFSAAGRNLRFTNYQLKELLWLKENLAQMGHTGLYWHAANSAAFLAHPTSHLDLIRIGTLLYGQSPLKLDKTWKLQNTWKFKTRLVQVSTLPSGHRVGYGGDYKTRKPTKVGVIGAGYASGLQMEPIGTPYQQIRHGLQRLLWTPLAQAFCERQSFHLIGRIGMGHSCLDLGLFSKLKVGQELTMPLRRVTANAGLPRIYLLKGKTKCISWNNKIFFNGQWRTNLVGLFAAKSPPDRKFLPEARNLLG